MAVAVPVALTLSATLPVPVVPVGRAVTLVSAVAEIFAAMGLLCLPAELYSAVEMPLGSVNWAHRTCSFLPAQVAGCCSLVTAVLVNGRPAAPADSEMHQRVKFVTASGARTSHRPLYR